MIPLPSEDVTPPVTKMYLAVFRALEAIRLCCFSMITGYKDTGLLEESKRGLFKYLVGKQ
jgi:hypothetical protein